MEGAQKAIQIVYKQTIRCFLAHQHVARGALHLEVSMPCTPPNQDSAAQVLLHCGTHRGPGSHQYL